MPFTQFKHISQVQQKYAITYREQAFIPAHSADFLLSENFLQELAYNLENFDAFSTEAACCELVIFPVLCEIYKQHSEQLALWVQKTIRFDETLSGVPDYLISKKSPLGKLCLETPLVAVVEAKKNDFERGWAQCLAELLAAQKLNNDATLAVYGIVTDGQMWQFGYLVEKSFTKNTRGYFLDDIQSLAASLHFIFLSSYESMTL